MSKEVSKKTSTDVQTTNLADWGMEEGINVQDVVIPKILVMQGLSELVAEGKASIGDLVVGSTGEKVGSSKEPVSILPFHLERSWVVFREMNGKFEFDHVEKAGPDASELPWEWEEGKIKFRRDYTYNYFVLLERDLKSPSCLPHVISFRRTSTRTGKELYTQMYVTNRAAGLSPAGVFLQLGGKLTKNDKGTYIVPTITIGRASTQEEVALALKWKKTFASQEVRVDHSDLAKEEVAPSFNDSQF